MSKKKIILFNIISLVVGVAIGVGATLGVTQMNGTGTIVSSIARETQSVDEKSACDIIDQLCGSTSECNSHKVLELIKNGDTVSKQRIVAAKWTMEFDNFDTDIEVIPYFTIKKSGKTSVQRTELYNKQKLQNGIGITVTYIPTDPIDATFKSPDEDDINLHLFVKMNGKWISDDGKIMTTDIDAFFAQNYVKSNVIYYGTKADLKTSEYSFMPAYRMTIHHASQFKSDIL